MVVEHVMTTRDGFYLQRERREIYKSSSSTVPIGPYITDGLSRGRIFSVEKHFDQFSILTSALEKGNGMTNGQKPFLAQNQLNFCPFEMQQCIALQCTSVVLIDKARIGNWSKGKIHLQPACQSLKLINKHSPSFAKRGSIKRVPR